MEETSKQAMNMRAPDVNTYYIAILQNKPYSLQDIIERINDGKITKEVVDFLKQKRDAGPGKKFSTNFNALVNMLYQASDNDASSRSILESVGFFPDDAIDDGILLKGGIRRRKSSRRKRRRSLRRKGGSRKRKGCSRRK
jgi:hypothetical protein